ncbi:hypothetical protein CRI78_14580 [Mycolicibacterium diernhoferi]|uniref:Esterase n=2 Tax=Mycolicibacterium diernhoferi TaxID=1801 RepID=A0A2A7NT88_9MYCO|nr:hypothetical protein CRI78_14580 [Mycolicibacterium diernhoferi]
MSTTSTGETHRRRPRVKHRRRRAVAALALAMTMALTSATAAVQFGAPWQMGAGDRNHVFVGDGGYQRYQVHVPPRHDGASALPVVMAIHGCGMTGFGWNSMKATTQFNRLADREGFIVVYPTQRLLRSAVNCWNSTEPREQHRGSGEPALLAGVARQVVEDYGADPRRVHVVGASSGAGAAVILAATYPDVFATVTSVAGGEYGLNQVRPDDPGATPPEYTARQAWVPPLVANRLVAHWTAVHDLVDDGLLNDSLAVAEETHHVPAASGGHAYTRTTRTAAGGAMVIESYLVDGMGHAWPGPFGSGMFTDEAGPDASALAWDFASRYALS